MIYYVVRVQLPSCQVDTLVFALNSNQNLMEQVMIRVGGECEIQSIQILGVDWP